MAKSKKEKKQLRKERQEQLHEMRERVEAHLRASSNEEEAFANIEYTLANEPNLFTQTKLEVDSDTSKLNDQEAKLFTSTMNLTEEINNAHNSLEKTVSSSSNNSNSENGNMNDDRVILPELPGVAAKSKKNFSHSSKSNLANKSRKHHKLPWQTLKLLIATKYGSRAAEYVGEHDGNSDDPIFTVLMKMRPHSVPVPSHWDKLRSFLANQADREAAVNIIPAEVEALGVAKIRASKDKKASVNQMAFITCFMTGTPLVMKTFDLHCSRFGEVFYEGKWMPKSDYTPGVLSNQLRQALGMSALVPPPWLYQMQYLRRLPPAYPTLRIPGLNAPIPAGAQWGKGQGQWGEAPRNEHNAILFPGVMDEAFAAPYNNNAFQKINGINNDHNKNCYPECYSSGIWGSVPALRKSGNGSYQQMPSLLSNKLHLPLHGLANKTPKSATLAPTPTLRNTLQASKNANSSAAETQVHINPVPFNPQLFTLPSNPQVANRENVVATPLEFVRVQDQSQNTTVAVGHVLVPKAAQQKQQQQQREQK